MVKKSQQQNHLDYWTKRQEDILRFLDQADIDMSLELSKVYREQAFQAQKDLFEFYQRYAEDNNMTYQDVVKKLTHEDLSDYRENAERYRKQAEKDPELLKRINEQYVSAKATRLDALHLDLLFKVGIMKGIIDKSFENYLKSASNYAYKKAVGGRVGTLNTPALNELVNTPFNGYNYSEQLWGNVDNLVRDLKDTLKKGFVRGDNPRSLARDLAKKYDVAKHRAETLLRTDGTMIINNATAKRYIDSGLKYYRDLVRLDGRTTDICRRIARLDERKLLSEMKPGVNAAPYHYNCRTTIIPDDEELNVEVEPVEDKSTKYFKDVTSDWIDGRDHQPQISMLNEYNKNGTTYKVDGHKVVLDHSNYEYKVANWLSKKTGLQVKIVPRINYPKKISTPDYIVNNIPFDLKEITGSGKNVIDGNLRKTKKQATNIIFDITKTPLSFEEIMGQLEHVYMIGRRGLDITIIKNKDDVLAVLKQK
ncbi:phage head morphogenesis protein [Streptococcus uberis]|uniref:CdiA C-terminal domain-containing protein n=1 Tax=Streptococcus uberis TaxID=1349 RepID=UPI0012B5FB3B|nr:minor capsid protein [Streptococcus uberis]MTC88026.1 phage head morphogenesis protein [Streptococcus uberis]